MDHFANNILQKSLRNSDTSGYKSPDISQRNIKNRKKIKKTQKPRRKSRRKEKLSAKNLINKTYNYKFKKSPNFLRKKSVSKTIKRNPSLSSNGSHLQNSGARDLRSVRKKEASRSRKKSSSRMYGIRKGSVSNSKRYQGKISELRQKIEQYEEETIPNMTNVISELRLQLEAKEIRIHELELDLQDKEDEIIEIQSHSSLQVEHNSSQMRDELSRAYQQINDMSLKIQKTKEYYQIELAKSQDEVTDLKDQLHIVQENAEEDFDDMRDEIKKLKKKLKKRKEKEKEKDKEREMLEEELRVSRNQQINNSNQNEGENFEQHLRMAREEIKNLRLRLKEVVDENDRTLQAKHNEIQNLNEELRVKEDELDEEKKRYNTVHLALRKKLEQNAIIFNRQIEEKIKEIERLNKKIMILEDFTQDDNISAHKSSYSGDLKSVNYVNNTLQIPENYLKEIESNIQQREMLLNTKLQYKSQVSTQDERHSEEKGLVSLLSKLESKMKNLENITQSTAEQR